MGALLKDLQFAVRTLFKRPAFAIVAIGSLALGIAINATIFTWVEGILLRPLPGVSDRNEMVSIKTLAPNGDLLECSYPDFLDFRDQAKTVSGVIAFRERPLYVGDAPKQQLVWSEMVSGNFFDVLGVKTILGRTFSAEEQAAPFGAAPVAVIGETLWHRKFQSDPNIIGRTIKLNRQPFTIIGVTPATFQGTINGLNFDLYVPVTMQSALTGSWNWLTDRNSRPLKLMARLAPNTSMPKAASELGTIARHLETAYPDSNRKLGAAVLALADSPDGIQRILGTLLRVLLVVSGAVLLIVCANVGSLLLVHASARQKEFGIRLSLGASRLRLLRQLLTEAFVLAVAGTGLGVLGSSWMTKGIDLFLPPTSLPVTNIGGRLDGLGLLFTSGLCVAATLLCGLIPAWQVFRRGGHDNLRETGRGLSAGVRSRAFSGMLVIAELSLAFVALIGSGLFIQTFRNTKTANPGFDPDRVLLAGLEISQTGYTREQCITLVRRLRDTLQTVPGVHDISLSEHIPLGLEGNSWEEVDVHGYLPQPGENMKLFRNVVSPGYFDTLKIPLIAGRDFTDRDNRAAQRVAIVNQTFVKRFLAGAPAIGRKFRAWGDETTIVGVARDSKYRTMTESPLPYFYTPVAQHYSTDMGLAIAVRTLDRPEAFSATLRSVVSQVDPNLTVSVTIPFVSYMSASYVAQKAGASLLTVLGGISLGLAMLGLYGMMAYSVNLRTHEIGIRMAIGARPGQVLNLVIGEGMKLCLIGLFLGLAISLLLSRLIASQLYGVGSSDLVTYRGTVAILTVFALFAIWLPARRASRIDPIEALRWE